MKRQSILLLLGVLSNLGIFYWRAFNASPGDDEWPEADKPLHPILKLQRSIFLLNVQWILVHTAHEGKKMSLHIPWSFTPWNSQRTCFQVCHLLYLLLQNQFTVSCLKHALLPPSSRWLWHLAFGLQWSGSLKSWELQIEILQPTLNTQRISSNKQVGPIVYRSHNGGFGIKGDKQLV